MYYIDPWGQIKDREGLRVRICGVALYNSTERGDGASIEAERNRNLLCTALNAGYFVTAAAPELLAVLEQIIRDLPTKRDWLDPDVEARARAAIAKAKGE